MQSSLVLGNETNRKALFCRSFSKVQVEILIGEEKNEIEPRSHFFLPLSDSLSTLFCRGRKQTKTKHVGRRSCSGPGRRCPPGPLLLDVWNLLHGQRGPGGALQERLSPVSFLSLSECNECLAVFRGFVRRPPRRRRIFDAAGALWLYKPL